jgi:hypothetical protein
MLFINTAARNKLGITNIYFCYGDKPPSDFGIWEHCEDEEFKNHKYNEHLFTEDGVRFYGRVWGKKYA